MIAAALIAVVGVAELAARHEGFGHPLLYRAAASGYEPVPNQIIHRLGKTMQVSALGTRGGAVAPIVPRGVWRIMVLGDSVANGGSQLNDAQTFPAVAAQQLNQNHCPSEILNASAGGWSLFDEAAWLNDHGLHGATTLVWAINSLDLDQAASTAAILDANPSFPSHRPTTALGEIVFRYALPRLGLGASTADNGSMASAHFDNAQFAAVSKLVAATKRTLDQRGVHMIVLFHDTLSPLAPDRVAARTQFFDQLRADNIPLLQTRLDREPDARRFYIDMIHPDAGGDALIGKLLADDLQKHCPGASG